MDLFSTMSDDQKALVFCVGALMISGGLMFFSHYLGQMVRGDKADTSATDVVPTLKIHSAATVEPVQEERTDKAA